MNVLHLQKSMTELKMHQEPRGIDQKTIIQHTLRFSDEDECFQKFRLVCKSWKNAVETIRFNRSVGKKFFYNLDQKITAQEILPTSYLSKYLKIFRKLAITVTVDLKNKNKIFPLVLNNMKKLNEITIYTDGKDLGQFACFAFQMLQNSNETLRTLRIPRFVIPDICFPKLTNLHLRIGDNNILLREFQNCFPKALKNMENLKTVHLELYELGFLPLCQHICENYSKHCISASEEGCEVLNIIMPAKIVERIYIWSLENKKYASHLEYIHMYISPKVNYPLNKWNRYQEIFDQCINLKAIEFETCTVSIDAWKTKGGDDLFTVLPTLSETNQKMWKERISYFQARGVHIANPNEIQKNENLRIKLAKEAGVTWRFHFC